MTVIGGFVFMLACVFGGYMVAGGHMGPILHALPFEMLIIGGAAVGTFLMSNSMSDVKHTLAAIGKAIKGGRYKTQDYLDLGALLHRLLRVAQQKGAAGLEPHIEKPEESPIFAAYPRIAKDHHAVHLICDYLRMVGMNADDPHQIEDIMAAELKKVRNEELHAAHALQNVADALPALGIVAAVLGVIKTMGSIDKPPTVLGAMIGSALVGTFLGVLLAYGMVGPLAVRLKGVVEEEARFLEVIRAVLVAHLHGNAPQVAVEVGRKTMPSGLMPNFAAMEAALQEAR
ncbi:flagellar motor stator protein MotA [Falsiroseomonas selenitidurans]|uniref:Flagellar motor stator protein MotA n=1 Tax=Falsiroseomonas selenitidurans TaxID=2716335 RepID=A0ABX1DX57_9PROT|nr:flagellar motor stator protein MotA [Falsiroseomonas selenitidurans]NKC29481.1 flagellar motor stator protein MotA [Falsiroseomonas selenitidurans]